MTTPELEADEPLLLLPPLLLPAWLLLPPELVPPEPAPVELLPEPPDPPLDPPGPEEDEELPLSVPVKPPPPPALQAPRATEVAALTTDTAAARYLRVIRAPHSSPHRPPDFSYIERRLTDKPWMTSFAHEISCEDRSAALPLHNSAPSILACSRWAPAPSSPHLSTAARDGSGNRAHPVREAR
jgi:hypothetical protein